MNWFFLTSNLETRKSLLNTYFSSNVQNRLSHFLPPLLPPLTSSSSPLPTLEWSLPLSPSCLYLSLHFLALLSTMLWPLCLIIVFLFLTISYDLLFASFCGYKGLQRFHSNICSHHLCACHLKVISWLKCFNKSIKKLHSFTVYIGYILQMPKLYQERSIYSLIQFFTCSVVTCISMFPKMKLSAFLVEITILI